MSTNIIGPYQTTSLLGRGGMGTVYRAKHVESEDEVALKLLSANYAHDEHFRSRFTAEIEALMKLDHPNIVRLISFGQFEGQLFFAMELVDGQSIHEAQKAGRRFDWKEVVDCTKQICAGLRHAHDRGIIHRDLKPGNLMLTEDDVVKLTDFGIAKQYGSAQITAVGGVVGTADFMAPEQLSGKPASIRTDMYSLGAVMYTLMARRPPFMFRSASEAAKVLERETPTRLRVLCDDCPPPLERIIHQLLERDPTERIGTAQALSIKLDHLLDELKTEVAPERSTGEDSEVHESFEIIEGPVQARDTFDHGAEVFNQPTAPAYDQNKTESGEDSDELKLADDDVPASKPTMPHTVESVAPATSGDYFHKVSAKRKIPQESTSTSPRGSIWPFVVAIAALFVIVVAGVFTTRALEKDADELFEEITQLMEEGNNQTASGEAIAEFLKRFPDDDRVESVRRYELQLEAMRLPRRIERRAGWRGAFELSPVEYDFYFALKLAETDPVAARAQFQAIVDVYQDIADDKETQQCVIASRTEIRLLDRVIEESHELRREQISRALDSASEMVDSNPERASEICLGIQTLYVDKEWASDLIERATEILSRVDTSENSSD